MNTSFTDDELVFLYKEIILYFEDNYSSGKHKLGYSIGVFTKKLKNNNIHVEIKKIDSNYSGAGDSAFYIHYRSVKGLSGVISIFKHFRNACAHGNINKIIANDSQIIELNDYLTWGKLNGQLSMSARLPLDKLSTIVSLLNKSKKV